ncbi:hypothetical protein FA13DRAFT_1719483 [Coprinellus micaceus]|uniref:Uncharacterized protein n=1 Tax=Coprinellus micaceus TaxID=71717 RepID=A0A4Y7SAZ6_COPMI|nr:hypothetical protein FA13DRAFT_1719483 [Coprinellus micaceus]
MPITVPTPSSELATVGEASDAPAAEENMVTVPVLKAVEVVKLGLPYVYTPLGDTTAGAVVLTIGEVVLMVGTLVVTMGTVVLIVGTVVVPMDTVLIVGAAVVTMGTVVLTIGAVVVTGIALEVGTELAGTTTADERAKGRARMPRQIQVK